MSSNKLMYLIRCLGNVAAGWQVPGLRIGSMNSGYDDISGHGWSCDMDPAESAPLQQHTVTNVIHHQSAHHQQCAHSNIYANLSFSKQGYLNNQKKYNH
jgi:hypothetical protein